jgi:hypothetical protein
MVYKIKHIFLVLVLPTKSVLSIKNHAVYNIHRLVWDSFARGTTGQLPIVPIHKTALRTVTVILIIFISTFYSMCILPLVEQELLVLLKHMSSPPIFNEVRVTRSLVLCVCFVDGCLSFFFWPLYCMSF